MRTVAQVTVADQPRVPSKLLKYVFQKLKVEFCFFPRASSVLSDLYLQFLVFQFKSATIFAVTLLWRAWKR